MFEAFAPEESMQLYGRGVKRRLPPMLGGDPRRVRMAYSLMFSLPGTPSLYYGEEIGMGEDPEAPGRMAVRSPMQWDTTKNGGFSQTRPGRLIQRVTPGGYGPDHVNFADQEHDPDSLWNFMRELISLRRKQQEIGWGEFAVVDQPEKAVLAHTVSLPDSAILAIHNLSAEPVSVTLKDVLSAEHLVENLLAGESVVDHAGGLDINLEGYGYCWLRIRRSEAEPA